jgi:hypothetical protein
VKAEATKRAIATATRVAGNDDGNGNGSKSNCDGNEGGVGCGRATTRVMAAATTAVGDDEGNGNSYEQATKRVRVAWQWQQ